MRRVAIVGFVLLALGFFVVGVQAQRAVNGDGSGSGGAAPVSVAVANFPQVQPVAVDKTVNVTGSVAVTNFPAVQPVTGTIHVENMPVDPDGNLRVTGTSAPRQPVFVKFADGVIFTSQGQILGPVPTNGYRRYSAFVKAECLTPASLNLHGYVQFGATGIFFAYAMTEDSQNYVALWSACDSQNSSNYSLAANGYVGGQELRLLLDQPGGFVPDGGKLDAWIYLFD